MLYSLIKGSLVFQNNWNIYQKSKKDLNSIHGKKRIHVNKKILDEDMSNG